MIKSIIRIALCYFLLFGQTIVYAQSTAALLPQGKTQFLNNNGTPLTSGTVDFYIPNTLTRKTTWQNAGETIANANPVVLDAGGRAIIYGSGTYRQIVKDRSGNLIYDAVTASAGTGGGTTGTGDGDLVGTVKPWAGLVAPNQYVFAYGQEISRTTYSVLLTAITLAQTINCTSASSTATGFSDTSQIPAGAVIESTCFAAGTTVVSKTSTTVTFNNNASLTTADSARIFIYGNGNGSTTFNVPDLRGYVIAGRPNMGGTASSNLTSTYFGVNPQATGAKGGSQSSALLNTHLPPYTPTGTVVAAGTISQITPAGTVSTPTITVTNGTLQIAGDGAVLNLTASGALGQAKTITATSSTPVFTGTPVTPTFTNGASTFTGTAQGGASTPFSVVQSTQTLNYIIKIIPDTNSADASGVTSLGLMTGDIACGIGLLCTGNVISANIGASAGAATILMNPNSSSATATFATIQGLTNQPSPNANNDYLVMFDAAAGTLKKVTIGAVGSAGVSGVSSFNGRVGAVAPASNDYTSSIVNYTAPGTGGTTQTQARYNQNILWAYDYGAVCDGTTDDATAFQRLINEAAALKTPAMFSGTCKIATGLTFPSAINFGGVDPYTSQLRPTAAINAISWAVIDSVVLHDFFIAYPGAATGTAITCDGVSSADADANIRSVISNVRVEVANIGLLVKNCAQSTFENNYFNSSLTYNILVNNPGNCDGGGDTGYINNTFIMAAASSSVAIFCGGGMRFIGNKWNSVSSAVAVQYVLGAGLTNSNSTSHIFSANSIEGSDYCFLFQRAAGNGLLVNINITGNEMVCRVGLSPQASGGSPWIYSIGVNSNTWYGLGGASQNVFVIADGVYSLSAGSNQLLATVPNTIASFMGAQITAGSTLGPFAKGVAPGATYAASTAGAASTVTCSAICY